MIAIDIDNVLADLDSFIARRYKLAHWDQEKSVEIWNDLATVDNLFYQLDVIPGSMELVDRLVWKHGTKNVEILTALPAMEGQFLTAADDKKAWVADLIHPELKVNTVVNGKNKYKFVKSSSDVLIDDSKRCILPWIDAGGVGILHTQLSSTFVKLEMIGLL